LKCPFCGHLESKVTDSRVGTGGDVIRRRRECETCVRRFTTYERVEEVLPLVIKKDGRREAFERQKALAGLRRACDKRAVPLERIEQIVDAIERELIDGGDKEIPSEKVGERVMAHLRSVDPVAYVRFASVYRQFKDIDELRSEIEQLSSQSGKLEGRGDEEKKPPASHRRGEDAQP
jgi:transcriptional repressor NrdR